MILLGDFHQSLSKKLRILLAFLILASFLKQSLRSLWSKPLSVYNSKLLTQPMIHTYPLRGMLVTLLALKKPVTFMTGFVIRIGFEPMALILEG